MLGNLLCIPLYVANVSVLHLETDLIIQTHMGLLDEVN